MHCKWEVNLQNLKNIEKQWKTYVTSWVQVWKWNSQSIPRKNVHNFWVIFKHNRHKLLLKAIQAEGTSFKEHILQSLVRNPQPT